MRKMKRTVVHSQHAVSLSALNQSPADIACRPHFGVSSAMTVEPAPHSLPELSPVNIAGQPQPSGGVVNTHQSSNSYALPHAHAMPQSPTLPPRHAAKPVCTASLSTGQRCPHQPSRPCGQNSALCASCEVCGTGITQPRLTVDCTDCTSTVSALGIWDVNARRLPAVRGQQWPLPKMLI